MISNTIHASYIMQIKKKNKLKTVHFNEAELVALSIILNHFFRNQQPCMQTLLRTSYAV